MKSVLWKIRGEAPLSPKTPFGLMGIINCTPDSFYINAKIKDPLDLACQMHAECADILDFGAESTNPLAQKIDENKECERLLPILSAFHKKEPTAILSVDTYHAKTAQKALEEGASIINDVSALLWDAALLDILTEYKPGYVLTHANASYAMRHTPVATDNIVEYLLRFFEERLHVLVQAHIPEDHIILDPGIGFAKTAEQNCTLLRNIDRFLIFDRPLLLGISQKRLFGSILQLGLHERDTATQVATALLWKSGVFWHRIHHVAKTRQTLLLSSHLTRLPLSGR